MLFTIAIDSREQQPFHFPEDACSVVRATLPTGDYAVAGDYGFAIERKSMTDFLGTVSTGWARFRREIARARKAGFTLPVIVEGSLTELFCSVDADGYIVAPDNEHPRLTAAFALRRIGQIQRLGGSVMMAENPFVAAGIAFSILYQRARELAIGTENYANDPDRSV